MIVLVLCCQMLVPYAAHLLSCERGGLETSTAAALAREIIVNCIFVLIGGCFAITLRIVGYSFMSHTNLLKDVRMWKSSIFYHISGTIEFKKDVKPSLGRLLKALRAARQQPFHGFLGKRGADIFYMFGLLAWALGLTFCFLLRKKDVSHLTIGIGFCMIAALVPIWFLLFRQHTITHTWMTARLMSLFSDLGCHSLSS
jgi:hypothetical protein